MTSLEQQLSDRRKDTLEALTAGERGALEDNPSALSMHDTLRLVRKLDDGLWAALLEIAREVDKLKG